eukprot:789199-Ditylum_brightwellii.AAC.1
MESGVNASVIFSIASDLTYAPSSVTKTILLISSACRPLAWSKARPTLDCRAAKRSLPDGSQSKAIFTALLQRLQTPSNRMMGRLRDDMNRCVDNGTDGGFTTKAVVVACLVEWKRRVVERRSLRS